MVMTFAQFQKRKDESSYGLLSLFMTLGEAALAVVSLGASAIASIAWEVGRCFRPSNNDVSGSMISFASRESRFWLSNGA